MNWIKIERDKNGFATDECLDKIAYFFVEYMMPVVLAYMRKIALTTKLFLL